MHIKFYKHKADSTAEGGIEYADRGVGAVLLETPTQVWRAIEIANPHKLKSQTGSLNFEESLTVEQALREWTEFRTRFIDPLNLDCWARFHPLENKSGKKKPHCAVHFGVSTCLPDSRQITPFYGNAKKKKRDFRSLDYFKRWRNKLMGYSSPDDRSKWRKYVTRIKRTWPQRKKDFVMRLDAQIRERKWKDREAIIFWLQSVQRLEITRTSDTTVSILHPYWKGKAIRLEGSCWHANWAPFHDKSPFVERTPDELMTDLEKQLIRRAAYFEKRYKFTQRKEINERTRAIESLFSLPVPGNQEQLSGGDREASGGPPAGTQTHAGGFQPKSLGHGAEDVGNRADLEEIWRAWSAAGDGVERQALKKKSIIFQDEDEILTPEGLDATRKQANQLLSDLEAELSLRKSVRQEPQPEPPIKPKDDPKPDNS
jgi:hypothetical protein